MSRTKELKEVELRSPSMRSQKLLISIDPDAILEGSTWCVSWLKAWTFMEFEQNI